MVYSQKKEAVKTELLVDGKNAFPEIIRCIRNAEESIFINMFIWRNDTIGCTLVRELLAAADKGVKVTVSKDRYGVICETCEESRQSFFNRRTSLAEKFKITALALFYNRDRSHAPRDTQIDSGALLHALLDHPNIDAVYDKNKYDHSKFYLFDRETLILGGVNVEDKENGRDYAGRAYHDYMVKLTEPPLIAEFLERKRSPASGGTFEMNLKERGGWFGMKDAYLKLINDADKSLTIVMAYFSPLPEFETAILRAARRGVRVRVVIPASANFQDNLNKKTVKRLMKQSGGNIKVYAYPGMLHAKLLMSEKTLSLGSCNITKKAFGQLDELNLSVPNDASGFAESVRESVEDTLARSAPLGADVRYRPIVAALESLLV